MAGGVQIIDENGAFYVNSSGEWDICEGCCCGDCTFDCTSGIAPDDAAISGNLILWFRACDETAYSDGDAVGTMTDQSGNSLNATQATAAEKPTYKECILGGKHAYRFDGSDDNCIVSDSATLEPANYTFFVVLVFRSQPSGVYGIFQKGTNDGTTLADRNGYYLDYRDFGTDQIAGGHVNSSDGFESTEPTQTVSNGVGALITMRWDGSTLQIWRDTTSIASPSKSNGPDYAGTPQDLIIGAHQYGSGPPTGPLAHGEFDLCELVFYDTALTNTQVTDLQTRLICEYDI